METVTFDQIYALLREAVEEQAPLAVYDCGSSLDIEDLIAEETLFSVPLKRPDRAVRNRELCRAIVETVNSLATLSGSEDLDVRLRQHVEALLAVNSNRVLH